MSLFGILVTIGIFLIGYLVGYGANMLKSRHKTHGCFIVDMREPENDMFRIEFFESIGELVNEHTIRLRVRRDTK